MTNGLIFKTFFMIKFNERYLALLLENSFFHKKVSAGKANYNSNEYKQLKK